MIRLWWAIPALGMSLLLPVPALAQALRVPVEYPGVSYPVDPTSPGGGRLTEFKPGTPANSPRWHGGAMSEVGTLRVPLRGPVPIPAEFKVRGGGSRAAARGLFVNPWVAAAAVFTWLAYEGVQACKKSDGEQFWCVNMARKYVGWHFYTPAQDLGWFPTPEAAALAYFKRVHTSSAWIYEYPPCTASTPGVYDRFSCPYKLTSVSTPVSTYSGAIEVAGRPFSEPDPGVRPATQEDFDKVADTHPLVAPDLQPGQEVFPQADPLLDAVPEPLPVTSPAFQPGFAPATESAASYPCTVFASGKCLDGWRISPAPTPDCPNCASLAPVTVDPGNPDAIRPPVAGTQPQPDTAAGSDAGTTPDKQRDPCELDPSRLGCLQLGNDDGTKVPKQSKTLAFTAEAVGLPAGCPADVPGPGGKPSVSYASACQAAEMSKPLVVALGAMAALMIVVAAVRS